jgi:hypothetical protein
MKLDQRHSELVLGVTEWGIVTSAFRGTDKDDK